MSKQAVSHGIEHRLQGEEELSMSPDRFLAMSLKRNLSAKDHGEDNVRKMRPLSAKRVIGKRVKVMAAKESEASFLIRLKPRQIKMDKERLYEENMSLKHHSNQLREEMVRLKTKNNKLEREINKKDEMLADLRSEKMPANTLAKEHLVKSLKLNIKDLRDEVKNKDSQIEALRKNKRNTQSEEHQIEIDAYIEECSRLRKLLQNFMKEKEIPPLQEDTNLRLKHELESAMGKNEKLKEKLRNMKREVQKPQENHGKKEKKPANGQFKAEVSKLKTMLETEKKKTEEFEHLQGKLIDLEYELKKAKKKNQKISNKPKLQTDSPDHVIVEPSSKPKCLVTPIDGIGIQANSRSHARVPACGIGTTESTGVIGNQKKKPPNLLKKIKKAARSNKMPLNEFLEVIDRNGNGQMDKSEFIDGMKTYKQTVKDKDVDEVFKGPVYIRQLEDIFRQYQFSPSSSDSEIKEYPKVKADQVQGTLLHFTFKMRVKGMKREDFLNSYSDNQLITKYQMAQILADLDIPDENLCRFLLESEDDNMITDVELSELQNRVADIKKKMFKYTKSWTVYSEHEQEIMDREISFKICSYKEKLEDLSRVTISKFYEILAEHNIEFSEFIKDFLSVFFYEQSAELNTVLVPAFIEKYGTMTETQIKSILAKQMERIAGNMNQKTLKEVFESDQDGFISENKYFEGLRSIGINSEDFKFSYFFFAKERGIDIGQFEDYMVPYGIPKLAESESLDAQSYTQSEVSERKQEQSEKSYSYQSDNENYSSQSGDQVIPVYRPEELNYQGQPFEEEKIEQNQELDRNEEFEKPEQGPQVDKEPISEHRKLEHETDSQGIADHISKEEYSEQEENQLNFQQEENYRADEHLPSSFEHNVVSNMHQERESSEKSQKNNYSSSIDEQYPEQTDIQNSPEDIEQNPAASHSENENSSVYSENMDSPKLIENNKSSESLSNSDLLENLNEKNSSKSEKSEISRNAEENDSSVYSDQEDTPKDSKKQKTSELLEESKFPGNIEDKNDDKYPEREDSSADLKKHESLLSQNKQDFPENTEQNIQSVYLNKQEDPQYAEENISSEISDSPKNTEQDIQPVYSNKQDDPQYAEENISSKISDSSKNAEENISPKISDSPENTEKHIFPKPLEHTEEKNLSESSEKPESPEQVEESVSPKSSEKPESPKYSEEKHSSSSPEIPDSPKQPQKSSPHAEMQNQEYSEFPKMPADSHQRASEKYTAQTEIQGTEIDAERPLPPQIAEKQSIKRFDSSLDSDEKCSSLYSADSSIEPQESDEIEEIPVVKSENRQVPELPARASERESKSISSKNSKDSVLPDNTDQISAQPDLNLPKEKSFDPISSESIKETDKKSFASNESSIKAQEQTPKEQATQLEDFNNKPIQKKQTSSDKAEYEQDFESEKSEQNIPNEEMIGDKSLSISSSLKPEREENYSDSEEAIY